MENIEKKNKFWEKIKDKYTHLEGYCSLEVRGLEDNNVYFHPTFRLDADTYITSQADVGGSNISIYALRFNAKSSDENQHFSVDISEELLDAIIVGYFTNKEIVMVALTTLQKVRNHIDTIDMYTTDYINNILIGSSIKEITQQFVQELSAVEKIIGFMQKNKSQV